MTTTIETAADPVAVLDGVSKILSERIIAMVATPSDLSELQDTYNLTGTDLTVAMMAYNLGIQRSVDLIKSMSALISEADQEAKK